MTSEGCKEQCIYTSNCIWLFMNYSSIVGTSLSVYTDETRACAESIRFNFSRFDERAQVRLRCERRFVVEGQ